MKKIRGLFVFVSIILCCLLFVAPATAADTDVIVSLQINNPVMEVNGAETEIDAGRGTMPIITDGRTLVPIRAIIEAFGGVVDWEDSTQTVLLTMQEDTVSLVIDSNTAYLNNTSHTLDVAPAIINERTMLPIRFVAESFNLGVAWDADSQTVSIIRNSFDDSEYQYLINEIPAFVGQPYAPINNNVPLFKDYEIITGSFEYYSELDELGRCDVCMASIATDIMPTEDRESISSVTPTGWINANYDIVDGGYLYNRCHLIGFQLTGENANKQNLITGTRYLNVDGMLPFENMVDDYIEATGNRVMYRVTPVFRENNLVADGVLLEAYSVEDNEQGISFCVYCYNVQPGISIDYATGASSYEYETIPPTVESTEPHIGSAVYRTPSGKRYHFDMECGGKNSFEVTLDEATNAGLTPCAKCAQ